MRLFLTNLLTVAALLLSVAWPTESRAQTNGGVQVETHVFGLIGSQVDRQTPLAAPSGPLVAYDTIAASINGAPPNHLYVQSSTIADWAPGLVKVSASAIIDGVCIPNGGGGCLGPGTAQGGAKAIASTKTVTAPGVLVPTVVQNNLTLSGSIVRGATFIEGDTQTAYTNGTVPDAKATFTYQVRQLQFNPDAGQDIFVQRARGTLTITSRYDGTSSTTSSGFVQSPSWTNQPLVLTTPPYTLQPGKDIEVTFSASVDSAFLYSIHGADVVQSSLAFGNTFSYSTDALAPAFSDSTVTLPDLGIQSGAYTEPVPEPAMTAMLFAGSASLVGLSRLRIRRGRERSN